MLARGKKSAYDEWNLKELLLAINKDDHFIKGYTDKYGLFLVIVYHGDEKFGVVWKDVLKSALLDRASRQALLQVLVSSWFKEKIRTAPCSHRFAFCQKLLSICSSPGLRVSRAIWSAF